MYSGSTGSAVVPPQLAWTGIKQGCLYFIKGCYQALNTILNSFNVFSIFGEFDKH